MLQIWIWGLLTDPAAAPVPLQPFTLTPLHIHDDRIGTLEAALVAHYASERVGE